MKNVHILFGIIISGLIFSSCNKNDNDSLKWTDLYTSQGYIKYKVYGTTSDSINLNDSIIADSYSKNDLDYANSYWEDPYVDDLKKFNIRRADKKDFVQTIHISFTKEGDLIYDVNIDIYYFKELPEGRYMTLHFYLYNDNEWQSINPNPITEVILDPNTNELSGKFKFRQFGYTLINISGEFRMKISRKVGSSTY